MDERRQSRQSDIRKRSISVVHMYCLIFIHEKNGFAEVSKNLSIYRFKNNFLGSK